MAFSLKEGGREGEEERKKEVEERKREEGGKLIMWVAVVSFLISRLTYP